MNTPSWEPSIVEVQFKEGVTPEITVVGDQYDAIHGRSLLAWKQYKITHPLFAVLSEVFFV